MNETTTAERQESLARGLGLMLLGLGLIVGGSLWISLRGGYDGEYFGFMSKLPGLLKVVGFFLTAFGAWTVGQTSAEQTIQTRAKIVTILYGLALALALLWWVAGQWLFDIFIGRLLSPEFMHHLGMFAICVLLVPVAEQQGLISGSYHYAKIARGLYLVFVLLLIEAFAIVQNGFDIYQTVQNNFIRWPAMGVALALMLYLFLIRRSVKRELRRESQQPTITS